MSSFFNIFGGATVNPSFLSYDTFSLTVSNSPLSLLWPLQFTNGTNVISQIVDVTANTTGLALVMPDATLVSVGQSVLFTNFGANDINIYDNDGITLLTLLPAVTSLYAYLIDNTTSNGTWRVVPWGGGFPAVVNIAAVSANPTDLIITGSPITSSGTFTFTLGGDLLAITNLITNGIVVKTAPSTWTTRTITGTSNQIVVTNGDGIAGNPVIALASAVSGINSLVAGNVQIALGGTNLISTSDFRDLEIAENLSVLAFAGVQNAVRWWDNSNTHYVAFQGAATIPADLTWTLPAVDGSVGEVLTTNGAGVLSWSAGGGGGAVTSVSGTASRITAAPTTGNVIVDIAPTYIGQASITTLGTITTGQWDATPVTVPFGGTGNTSFTAYSVICAGTTSTGQFANVVGLGSANQVLTSNGPAALPTWQANTGILQWVNQSTSISMTANTAYFTTSSGGVVTLTIPASVPFGTVFEISGVGTSGWILQASGGQSIIFGNQTSSVAGTWASSDYRDSIKIVCSVADTTFKVLYAVGNITPT